MDALNLYKLLFAKKSICKNTVQDADTNLDGIELQEHTKIHIQKVETNDCCSTFAETALTANFFQSEDNTDFRQRLLSEGSSTETTSTISPESSPSMDKKNRSGIPRPIWTCKRRSSTETASISSDSSSEQSPLLTKKSLLPSGSPVPLENQTLVSKSNSTPRKIKAAFGNLKTKLVASRQNKYQVMGAGTLDPSEVGDSGFEDTRDTATRMSSRKQTARSSGKSKSEKIVKKHCCLGNMQR